MNPEILTQIDSKGYQTKPEKKEFAFIRSRFRRNVATVISLNQLEKAIETGHTIYPVKAKGIRATDWEGQNLFIIDIDNDREGKMLTEEETIGICKKYNIKPIMIYQTYSHTPKYPKLRVLFLCEELITDEQKRKTIIETLIRLFPQADTACKNADRMFLGTNKKVCYRDETAVFTFDDIIRINGELPQVIKTEDKITGSKKYNNNGIDLYEEVKNFDLYSFLRNECGAISINGSNYTMFHECPICNGHDDFVYFPDSNTYTSKCTPF